MRLDVLSAPRPATPTVAAPGMLAEWRVGALLQAVAVRDATTGQLFLDIGNSRYPARIASGDGSGPSEGEQLQLRVLRNSPVLALETLSSTAQTQEGEVTADALRRYLPRQASPALMSSNLGWIARNAGSGATGNLPRSIVQAVTTLWQALPEASSLGDAKTLEQAVMRSGAFLESTLAGGNAADMATAARTDLKALMLQLSRALSEQGARPAAALTETSPAPLPNAHGPLGSLPAAPATLSLLDAPSAQMNELSRQVDGALARLTTVQVANATQDSATPSMMIELPVRHEERAAILRLRVERDAARQQDTAGGVQSWTVEAAVDLGAIGALHARVTLAGHRIGVQLRAESPAVVDSLSARALDLESMLRESGFDVDRIVCLHGMPAGDSGSRPTRLLDVRA